MAVVLPPINDVIDLHSAHRVSNLPIVETLAAMN
jgi:hypothetical protein